VSDDYLDLPGDVPPEKISRPEKAPDSFDVTNAVDFANGEDEGEHQLSRKEKLEAATKKRALATLEETRQNLPSQLRLRVLKNDNKLKLLDKAWRKLTKRQQVFLTLLRENRFNQRSTCRMLEHTSDHVSRSSLRKWIDEDEDFGFVMDVMKTVSSGASIDRERLILRAEEIAEESLEPTPILYQGAPTGFYENSKETALKANEQLMKVAGMLRSDEKSARVTVRLVNLAGSEGQQIIDAQAEVVPE